LSYQVVAGDTIWGIAARFGSTVDAIIRANRLQDADSIVPGARLVIPR
jgi:LysM repeat protein